MIDDDLNIVQKVILEAGGYTAFARRMSPTQNTTTLREFAEGRRIPKEVTRLRMVKASRGRLTEADIIAITGKVIHESANKAEVNPMWDHDDDERRHWIWETAVKGARKQLAANRRRKT